MKKHLLIALIILFSSGIIFSAIDDNPWKYRHTSSGAQKAYYHYKMLFDNYSSYEISWKFSRAAFHYADRYVTDKNWKKIIFTEGKIAGEKAVTQSPEGVEGHTYLAMCLGSWCKVNGIFSSLRAVPVLFSEVNKSITINPGYLESTAMVIRANLYLKLPKSMGGNISKAELDLKKAITQFPENRCIYGFLVEVLLKQHKLSEAKSVLNRGLTLPYDKTDTYSEDLEITKLKRLKKKLR